MKLHRIEVENLNSLYGKHFLDLDRDLGGASLFLIHGATGAGKSTLMDAVSLALFGETPRLPKRRNQKGKDNAGPGQVMSRGTAYCHAAAEFSRREADGSYTRFRAEWSIHRAKDRPDGKLQDAKRSLKRQESDGSWQDRLPHDTKQSAIAPVFLEELEGFTVEDFQRSMLLAQGRFDELLNADNSARARILERLTDTQEYRSIGARAASLNKAYEDRRKLLEDRCNQAQPVSAEVYAAAQALEAKHSKLLSAAMISESTAKNSVEWWQGNLGLQVKRKDLQDAELRLQSAEAQAAEGLGLLLEHERCEAGFGLLDKASREDFALREATQRLDALRVEFVQTESLATEQSKQAVLAQHAAQAAQELATSVRGPAASLSSLLRESETELEQLRKMERDASQALLFMESQVILERERARLDEAARTAVTQAQSNLESLTRWAPLRRAWRETLRDRLVQLRAQEQHLHQQANALAASRTEQNHQARETAEAISRLARERATHTEPLEHALSKAETTLSKLVDQQGLAGSSPAEAQTALRREIEVQHKLRAQAEAAALETREAATTKKSVTERSAQLKAARQTLKERQSDLSARKRDELSLETPRRAAQDLYDRLKTVAAIALRQTRLALQPSCPCPVCGSEEHPFVDHPDTCPDDDVVRRELEEAERTLGKATEAFEAAKQEREKLDREEATCRGQVNAVEAALAEAEGELLKRAQQAAVACKTAGLPHTSNAEDIAHHLSELDKSRTARVTQLERFDEAASARHAAEQQLNELRSSLDEKAKSLHDTNLRLDEQKKALEDQARALSKAQADFAQGLETAQEELTSLGLKPPRNLKTWDTEAERKLNALDAAEKASEKADSKAKQTEADLRATRDALSRARTGRDKCATDAAEQRRRVEQLGKKVTEHREELARLWRERPELTSLASPPPALPDGSHQPGDSQQPDAPFLSTPAPDDVRQQADELLATLRQQHDAAAVRLRATHERRNLLRGRRETEQRLLEEAQVRVEATQRELASALERLELKSSDALAARRLPQKEHQQLHALRHQLKEQRDEWLIRGKELQAAHDLLDRSRPAELPEGTWTEDEASAQKLNDKLNATLVAARAVREDADAARRDSYAALQNLAQQAKAAEAVRSELDAAEKEASIWRSLHRLIGVGEGKQFQDFAQALNLQRLIGSANVHLARLSARYRLNQRLENGVPTLDFVVEDGWNVGEPRSLRSLSGGERFLVSLALALGLSDLRSSKLPIETLLLDEGFGTLDPETLEVALSALAELHSEGRQVGLISHVAGLQERIEARVLVEEVMPGQSRIRVNTPSGS